MREWLCGQGHCPPEVLVKLSQDENKNVRWRVAKHPSCPPDTLVTMWRSDPDPQVRRTAADNPNLPEEYRALDQVVR
jgi:hypothetical protein